MVQILQPRENQPSGAQRFIAGLAQGAVKEIPEYFKNKKRNAALNRAGIDPDLPNEFQQLSYQDRLRRQEREEEHERALKLAKGSARIDKSLGRNKQKQELSSPGLFEDDTNPIEQSRPRTNKNEKPKEKQVYPTERLPEESPQYIKERSHQIGEESRNQGIAVSDEEIENDLHAQNNQNIHHNNLIDTRQNNQRTRRSHYATEAENTLRTLMDNPSLFTVNAFKKHGEELADSDASDTQISDKINKKVTKLKNDIIGISDKIPSANRIYNVPYRKFNQTHVQNEKLYEDIREKIKPLLDQGMYDEVRTLLKGKGFEAEERESLISSLGEGAKKEIAQFPKIKDKNKGKSIISGLWTNDRISKTVSDRLNIQRKFEDDPMPYSEISPEQLQNVTSSLSNVLKSDPSTNLVLLRKAYMEKGVPWDTFKEAIGKAILEGKIEMSDEQTNAYNTFSQPPLGTLDTLFYNMGLTGK